MRSANRMRNGGGRAERYSPGHRRDDHVGGLEDLLVEVHLPVPVKKFLSFTCHVSDIYTTHVDCGVLLYLNLYLSGTHRSLCEFR
jgi:hypothetical protein